MYHGERIKGTTTEEETADRRDGAPGNETSGAGYGVSTELVRIISRVWNAPRRLFAIALMQIAELAGDHNYYEMRVQRRGAYGYTNATRTVRTG
ncbi:hypothetical protein EVAR_103315_1 [Eumeta japonica]|uniref:Uncharacterized protein n=1 Tax=Eumeta variegata TaxID=151549 RepID=A0A4C1XQV2_EUMVA|nr:hypothetical protein EVAR_103315_1 [Eumeta japonica]